MSIKIDIRKAFDTVSWDLQLAVLGAFGFDAKFLTWVDLRSARLSILFNGSPVGYFGCSQGLWILFFFVWRNGKPWMVLSL